MSLLRADAPLLDRRCPGINLSQAKLFTLLFFLKIELERGGKKLSLIVVDVRNYSFAVHFEAWITFSRKWRTLGFPTRYSFQRPLQGNSVFHKN